MSNFLSLRGKTAVTRILRGGLALSFCCLLPSFLQAQGESDSMVRLIDRMDTLEDELRDLRGQLDESRHELSLLKSQFDTLNTDLDVRLKPVPGQSDSPVFTVPEAGQEAASPLADSHASTAEESYEQARSFLEKGDYHAAEKALSSFLETYPKHAEAGAALYWLGVTHFVERQYEKAVAHFAKVYRSYPKSAKVPDSLLKLAKSLKALDRKGDACTALDQLAKDFPKAFPEEVAAERKKYGCP